MSNNDHTGALLHFLGDALSEAADDLRGGDEERAAERLRIVHDALRAAESAPDWETLALMLEPHVARLRPSDDTDDAWPYHEHLDDLLDLEEEDAPPNLPFPLGKVH